MKSPLISEKEITNSDNNIDTFEEMDKDNNIKEDLVEKRKKPKKKETKLNVLKCIITNILIVLLIFTFYLLFQNYEGVIIYNKEKLENKAKSDNNKLSLSNFKLNKIINNTDIYDLGRNKLTKFPIESISQFPSGNIISVDWITINIYDNNYNLIQKIKVFDPVQDTYYKKDQKKIYKVEIKDDNIFAICANDGSLKIYSKQQGKEFELKQNIEKEGITEIKFDSEGKIICGARDNIIKIYKMNEKGEYKIYKIRNFASSFYIKLLEEQNLLISKDINYIQFYDIKDNYKLIETMKQKSVHEIEKLDDDKIILYTNNSLKVVSIKEYKVIKTTEIGYQAVTVKLYEDKGIILVGGCVKDEKGWEKSIFNIYKKDTFELMQTFDDFHGNCVKGAYILDNGLVATFGDDRENGFPIKIWHLD